MDSKKIIDLNNENKILKNQINERTIYNEH